MTKERHSRSFRRYLAVALPALAAVTAPGWGTVGHLFINAQAVNDLPASMSVFIFYTLRQGNSVIAKKMLLVR